MFICYLTLNKWGLPMAKYLSTYLKEKYLPLLIQRDGPNCFYCNLPFNPADRLMRRTYDHLDNNKTHNDMQNLVLAHFFCNEKKRHNAEYQIMAREKLRLNELSAFEGLRVCEILEHDRKETEKVIDINVTFRKITKTYIESRLIEQGVPALSLKDTKHSVAYIMQEKTGHGSSQTAARYIDDLCSSAGPFAFEEQDGIWYIVKKQSKNYLNMKEGKPEYAKETQIQK